MNEDDPLRKLISSNTREIDRKKLAELLDPFVVFDEATHEMGFKTGFGKLQDNVSKLEVILIGEKAKALIFDEKNEEGLASGEIIALEVMPEGSVKSTLKKLFDEKRILKDKKGKYYLPSYKLDELFQKYLKQ